MYHHEKVLKASNQSDILWFVSSASNLRRHRPEWVERVKITFCFTGVIDVLQESVVGSGNSTFCKKRWLRKWKRPKNQDLYLYSILKTEKRKLFFNFQSPLWKLEKSAPFSHEKPDIFRIFLRYKVKQLSWVIFISHESQKSWKEKFLESFQLFSFFFKVKKKSTFFLFLCLVLLGGQLSNKGGNPNLQSSQLTTVKNDK